jgi:polysaccharide biosynthesis/export protein
MKSLASLLIGASFAIAVLMCASSSCQTAAPATGNTGASASEASNQSVTPARTTRPDDTFVIGNDDVLSINVWKEPDLTKQIPVRSDGKISLPLIGDIQAAGRTPAQLEQDIADRLKSFITDPQVVVIVQEIHSLKFNILGEVAKPGSYPLTVGTTIVDAIAIAGGFKDFAKKKGIYVLRQGFSGNELRFAFNYQDFIKGKDTKQNIVLKPHDTIVVP